MNSVHINARAHLEDLLSQDEGMTMPNTKPIEKRLASMTAQRDAWKETALACADRRAEAEFKYNQILGGVARAVVHELRAAKFIEIHDQMPTDTQETTNGENND